MKRVEEDGLWSLFDPKAFPHGRGANLLMYNKDAVTTPPDSWSIVFDPASPQAGKIIATTLDYPMIMDTFGCTPKFLSENPKAAKALADSYFEAVDMIAKEPKKSFEIMGADVKQTGEQFAASAKYLRWQGRAENKAFFQGEYGLASACHQEALQITRDGGDALGLVREVVAAQVGCDDPEALGELRRLVHRKQISARD